MMRSILRGLCLACALAVATPAVVAMAAPLDEPPILADAVREGLLPPMKDRLPAHPRVIDLPAMGRETGRFGGVMRMLMSDQRDIRMMTIYGYARMVVFDEKGDIQPDILEKVDVTDGRSFTLHIRPGHKWSDGEPLTAEDFRYYWEDVANNARLSPGGPPFSYIVNDKPPKFEVIDPLTVRYAWDVPNPGFLPALAGAQPLPIVMPAHYLKQFHERYADKAALAKLIKDNRVKDWGAMHERKSRQYRPENPDLPVLDPWRNTTAPPAEMFVFERNPYFHRTDSEGRQLPYVDRVTLSTGTASLIPAKAGAGEADLQARYLRFDNYTFLKRNAKMNDFSVRLWTRGEGSYVALYPNLTTADPVWRALLHDVRVRRALSVGINRHLINKVVFFGLARESANTVLPESPLFQPELQRAWADHDTVLANRLLDQAGLEKRDDDGVRFLPDGRRAELTVDASGEVTEEIDVLELIGYDWMKIGVKLLPRTAQRDVLRRRIIAGQTVMSVSQGIDNAVPSADMEPSELAPAHYLQSQWPLWGKYVQSRGQEGEKPDVPAAIELIDLHARWKSSVSHEERERIWREMLRIQSEQVFSIGVVNGTSQPVIVSNRLRNVPEKAIYSFEPGAFFGQSMPDTFWYADAKAQD